MNRTVGSHAFHAESTFETKTENRILSKYADIFSDEEFKIDLNIITSDIYYLLVLPSRYVISIN